LIFPKRLAKGLSPLGTVRGFSMNFLILELGSPKGFFEIGAG
jgi:hypothetical protein